MWDPNPVDSLFKDPGHVSIGDVGYLDNGTFMRIFNVGLARDHPSNKFIEIPEWYKPLKREHFDCVYRDELRQGHYLSHHVSQAHHVSQVDNVDYKSDTDE